MFVPKRVFLTSGIGVHKDRLTSFEYALRDAGVEKCNLVLVSSILPPNCEILPRAKGVKLLKPGQIAFSAMDQLQTDENGRLIAAAVGMSIPKDRSINGYLSEHHAYGEDEKEAGKYSEHLVATMMKRQTKSYSLSHAVAATKGKRGVWTTVFAGAIFID